MPTTPSILTTLRAAWMRDVLLSSSDRPFVSFDEYRRQREAINASASVCPAPNPAPRRMSNRPRRTRQTIASRLNPKYLVGFEFEGLIRREVWEDFRYCLMNLSNDKDGRSMILWGADPSISQVSGYRTVEFRTKPLALKPGLELLEWVLSFLYLASETKDWLTNRSCGFHMNISEKKVFQSRRQISLYAHVLTRFDEKRVLRRFGREHNEYCAPFINKIYAGCVDSNNPKDIARFFRESYNHDDCNKKYFSVALRDSPRSWSNRLKNHRIEFRGMGNKDYHLKHEELKHSINEMVEAVKLGVKEVSAT